MVIITKQYASMTPQMYTHWNVQWALSVTDERIVYAHYNVFWD